jgi:hypothetical protein
VGERGLDEVTKRKVRSPRQESNHDLLAHSQANWLKKIFCLCCGCLSVERRGAGKSGLLHKSHLLLEHFIEVVFLWDVCVLFVYNGKLFRPFIRLLHPQNK